MHTDLPCEQSCLPRELPSKLPAHKAPSIRVLQSLLKPRGKGEMKFPWENLPMFRCSWPCSVCWRGWKQPVSGAHLASGTSCALSLSSLGGPAGYMVGLLSHTLYLAPGWFKEPRELIYFPAEEEERSHAAQGAAPMGAAPISYCRCSSSHHHAVCPAGHKAKSPRAGRAFPLNPEQELVLTQLLAVSTCRWCRNNASHGSGEAFG